MAFFDKSPYGNGTLAQLMQQAPNFPAYLPDTVREAIMTSPTFNENYFPFPWSQAVQDLWKTEKAAFPPGKPDLVEEFMRIIARGRDQGA